MCVDTVNTHVCTNIPAEGCFESPSQGMGNVHGRCREATHCLVCAAFAGDVGNGPRQEELDGDSVKQRMLYLGFFGLLQKDREAQRWAGAERCPSPTAKCSVGDPNCY